MYTVRIRKNSTSQEVENRMALDWEEGSEYWWSEGNYSCDDNRHNVFMEGLGLAEFDVWPECSDTEYKIVWIKTPDGETVYSEE